MGRNKCMTGKLNCEGENKGFQEKKKGTKVDEENKRLREKKKCR